MRASVASQLKDAKGQTQTRLQMGNDLLERQIRLDFLGRLGLFAIRSAYRASNHARDRKSTRLNSSHLVISYAVFCLKKKKHDSLKSNRKRQVRALVRPWPESTPRPSGTPTLRPNMNT